MLKDITNTHHLSHQQSSSKQQSSQSLSGQKQSPAAPIDQQKATREEQIRKSYQNLQESIQKQDHKNCLKQLKNLSLLYSKGKITQDVAQIEFLMQLDVVEKLVQKVETLDLVPEIGNELQNAALWFLANVLALVSESQIVTLLAKHDLIETLLFFLDSESCCNIEQSLWALANLVSYIEVRNLALEKHIIERLLGLIAKMTHENSEKLFTLKINRTLIWLISNLCRKPSPSFEYTSLFLPYLATMIHFSDPEILRDACLALGNLVLAENNSREDDHQQIEEILNFNVGSRCIKLLLNENREVQMAALVLLGHLTYGNELQTQRLIDLGVLLGLKHVLTMDQAYQRKKEALFALSNISAGSQVQLDKILESGILQDVKSIITTLNQKQQLIDEALFCFMNFTYNANESQIKQFLELGTVEILLAQLKMRFQRKDKLVGDIIESIENVIEKAQELPERVQKTIKNIGYHDLVKSYNTED